MMPSTIKDRLTNLPRDCRGASAVEFMLIVPIMMLVFLTIVSVFFYCVDLQVMRLGSFMAARGQLADDPCWKEAGEVFGHLVFDMDEGVADPVTVRAVTKNSTAGARLRVYLKPLFSEVPPFGDLSNFAQDAYCYLGTSPNITGDNQTYGLHAAECLGLPHDEEPRCCGRRP